MNTFPFFVSALSTFGCLTLASCGTPRQAAQVASAPARPGIVAAAQPASSTGTAGRVLSCVSDGAAATTSFAITTNALQPAARDALGVLQIIGKHAHFIARQDFACVNDAGSSRLVGAPTLIWNCREIPVGVNDAGAADADPVRIGVVSFDGALTASVSTPQGETRTMACLAD